MTKSSNKKKKNYKLRRRVKRTVASLTMVMAIVVAAIPVENYGTMQASGVDGEANLQSDASDYLLTDGALKDSLKKYDAKDYENNYTGDSDKVVQHIEGDTFINAYRIKFKGANSEDAIIVESRFERDIEKFDIREIEYYDYVQMNKDYISAVENAFDEEKYTLEYSKESAKDYSKSSVTDTAGNVLSFNTVNGVAAILTEQPKDKITDTSVTALDTTSTPINTDKNPYIQIKESSPMTAAEIFETYAPEQLKSHTDSIEQYNTELKKNTDILDEITNKADTALTSADASSWNTAVSNIENLMADLDGLLKFEMTFAQIRALQDALDKDDNGLKDIVDYAICRRIKTSKGLDLTDYALKRLVSVDGNPVYVPINTSNLGGATGQPNDDKGYLTGGKANIKGIASNAFNIRYTEDGNHPNGTNREVGTITIPGTVEFIGEKAFANSQSYLKEVTIDDSYCQILGDEAFSGCEKLASIKFTSGNSRLWEIGCMAFYNTSLTNITFPENVREIGAGCLYYSNIEEMTMGGLKNGELMIEPYAFFGCEKLSKVNFAGESTDFKIGDAAFALTAAQGGGALESFAFPAYMNQLNNEANYSEYILAGRENLKTVVLPGRLGNSISSPELRKVPNTTFSGCKNLECVEFPNGAYDATYDSQELFKGVLNEKFYVRGPESGASTGSIAEPRRCTWNAVPGHITEDGKQGVIPYVFKGADGKEHMKSVSVRRAGTIISLRLTLLKTRRMLFCQDTERITRQEIRLR